MCKNENELDVKPEQNRHLGRPKRRWKDNNTRNSGKN
jgi:hypothetical protein